MARLTTTSYLVLGLLSTREWSAYEIAEQLDKGVAEVWPRASRQLYNAPKQLVDEGLVTARKEISGGRRSRTVYAITPAGRAALASWIGTDVQHSAMEFDGLVRVLFADQGDVATLRANLRAVADQARLRRDLFVSHADYAIASDGGSMPERAHTFVLANRYMIMHFNVMIDWAEWALEQVQDWPDTATPAKTHHDQILRIFRENAGLAPNPTRRSHI